jgi:hypothetical protein
MFQFPWFASVSRMLGLPPNRLPHSDIHGSMLVCSSPWLIAAYHVLRRLPEPRHPPHALSSLINASPKYSDTSLSLYAVVNELIS